MPAKFCIAIVLACALFHQFTAPASAQPQAGEIRLFTAPDESSPIVETVKKGVALSPMAETVGAGGTKWYLVQTKTGSAGWMKRSDSDESKKMEGFFKSLPKEPSIFSPTASPPSPSASSSRGEIFVPVEMRGSAVIVPVTLNNSVTAYLALDTGATTTVVSRRIANSLALQSIGAIAASTVGGPITASVARLESLKVGDAEVQNLIIAIHDFSRDPRVEGLLGLDFLKRFHMSLDSRKRLLVLGPR